MDNNLRRVAFKLEVNGFCPVLTSQNKSKRNKKKENARERDSSTLGVKRKKLAHNLGTLLRLPTPWWKIAKLARLNISCQNY